MRNFPSPVHTANPQSLFITENKLWGFAVCTSSLIVYTCLIPRPSFWVWDWVVYVDCPFLSCLHTHSWPSTTPGRDGKQAWFVQTHSGWMLLTSWNALHLKWRLPFTESRYYAHEYNLRLFIFNSLSLSFHSFCLSLSLSISHFFYISTSLSFLPPSLPPSSSPFSPYILSFTGLDTVVVAQEGVKKFKEDSVELLIVDTRCVHLTLCLFLRFSRSVCIHWFFSPLQWWLEHWSTVQWCGEAISSHSK